MRACVVCAERLPKGRLKYCSNACEVKNWKLIASKKAYRERNKEAILAYNRDWNRRNKVLKDRRLRERVLDDASCLRCGTRERLNIHHVKQGRYGGDNSVSNLTIFCFDCHMLWHKTTDTPLKGFWKL